MKRSRSVRLTVMGAATATGLAACDQAPPNVQPAAFQTVQECVSAGFEQAACQTAYDQAMQTHMQSAPRFNTKEECEAGVDVQRCEQQQVRNPDGSFTSFFLPAIGGYLLGQALANRGGGYSYGGYGGYGGPIYRSRQYPGYRDSSDLLSNRTPPGLPSANRAPMRPPNVNTTTIARQGFGSSGFGGGGG